MPSQGYRSCLYASPLIRIVDFSVGIAVRLGCECVLFVRSYCWSILLRSPSTDFCMHPQFRLQVEPNFIPIVKELDRYYTVVVLTFIIWHMFPKIQADSMKKSSCSLYYYQRNMYIYLGFQNNQVVLQLNLV